MASSKKGSMYAPPPGQGGGTPFDQIARNYMSGLDGPIVTDPAFARSIDATDENTKARAKLIYRDVPLVTIQNTWSIEQARGAIYSHLIGMFYASGMLCDSIMGDDRVTATLNSRASALFGREARFSAADKSAKATACLEAWKAWWPRLAGDSAFRETFDYATMMGFGHDQIIWDRDQPELDYAPSLRPWHPVFTYYDWTYRCFMAIGQDAMIPIIPGNGKWVQHAPYGSYRGWLRGALRPVVEPWMLRHFGFRDMASFGEVHGNPTRVGYVPIVGDPTERELFEQKIASLGANTALSLPRGVDEHDGMGYDYKLVEAQSKAWEVHPAQIDRCDMAIVLAILMVNLTTQVDGGSYGATKSHMDKEKGGTQFDNQSWKFTIYNQIARPFAYLNFGDANLAPWTWFDVTGRDEYEANADQWNKAATGLNQFAQAGMRFDDPEELGLWLGETMGLHKFPKFKLEEPKVAGGMIGSSEEKPGQKGGFGGPRKAA